MIAVICKRVERDTASGGSEIGGGVRMRPRKGAKVKANKEGTKAGNFIEIGSV
jgi:hypothetical protein